MRIVFISDIHGVPSALKAALAAADALGYDRIALLGDLLYHGPRNGVPDFYNPEEVARILNGLKDKIVAVRGNCDAEVDQCVLEFPILAEYMQIVDGGKMIFATHGDHYNTGHLPPLSGIDVLLHGHTHVPACEDHNGYLYCNPGSVSIPKGGSVHSYMTMEDGLLEWHRLRDGSVYMSRMLK